jgi:hypothetical protein
VFAGLGLTMVCTGSTPAAADPTDVEGHHGTARTVRVTGQQIPVDMDKDQYVMRGGLVGTWRYRPRTVLHDADTMYAEAGVEVFNGCIDRSRNGRCDGRDPRGELHLAFLYWASFDPEGNLIRGQCVHPITGGRAAFAGARGRLDMVDRPVGAEVRTTYRGHLVLNAVPTEGDAPTPPPAAGGTAASSTAGVASKTGC